MTSTVFTDNSTVVVAAWLNDVNTSTYTSVPALQTKTTNLPTVSAFAGTMMDDPDAASVRATIGAAAASSVIDYLNATRIDVASATTVDLTTNAPLSSNINITGTTTITGFTVAIGKLYFVRFNAALILTNNANIVTQTGANITTAAGDTCILRATAANTVEILSYVQAINNTARRTVPVRQTVLSGPVDTNGFSAFGGSTGTTTVTASGTLVATASNGTDANGNIDYVGFITNPSWTSLSTNGTMYLYLDIALNGTCTTGSTTLLPTYRWGGADVTTNNQFTFNIQEMVGKVGNGATATQTYRVFVGEVTVAGAVVTAITWYQLQGRYTSATTATLPAVSTKTSANHNIGVTPKQRRFVAVCTTTDGGYAVGEELNTLVTITSGTAFTVPLSPKGSRLAMSIATGSSSAAVAMTDAGTSRLDLTLASWSYRFEAERGW